MEEKKQIKIRLGTVIFLFIIMMLVVALAGMWLYFNNKTEEKNEKEENVVEISKQNVIEETRKNEIIENEIKPNVEEKDETITNKDFIKNITLNGNSHEIAFRYNNTKSDEINNRVCDEVEILFDNKVVKTFYDIYRPETEKEEPKVKIILGEDNKQYIIIQLNTYPVAETNYFTFINEKGEVLGTLDNYTGSSINYNGNMLSYEINQNNMKLYKTLSLTEYNPLAVAIEYEVKINSNMLNVIPTRIYSSNEVQMAGSR